MSDRTEIEIPGTGLLPETPVEEHQESEGRQPSARELAMQKIAAKREAALLAEVGLGEQPSEQADAHEIHSQTRPTNSALGEVEEDRNYHDPYATETPTEPAEPKAGAHKSSDVPRMLPIKGQAEPPVPPGIQTFPVDIDGQQIHVTQDQLVHLARMGAIANQAMYQYQTQQHQPPQQAQAPVVQERARADVGDDLLDAAVQNLQYGDKDGAKAALRELIRNVQLPQAQQLDLVAIGNYAAQKARHEARLEHETQIIRQEYADVMNDRYLAGMAAARVAEIRQQNVALGRTQSDLDVYREAGNFVLEKFGKPRPGQQVEQSGETGITAPQAPNLVVRRSVSEIEGRKRAAPRAVSQVIDRRSTAPQAPKAPSPSDVVDMMRKARGQTSMK